jgi:hypothetical protein
MQIVFIQIIKTYLLNPIFVIQYLPVAFNRQFKHNNYL